MGPDQRISANAMIFDDEISSEITFLENDNNYDWWSSPAPPVLTFLEQADIKGVQIAPFCTHGGGGSGHIRRDMEKAGRGAAILPELSVYGGSGKAADIQKWLKKISFTK